MNVLTLLNTNLWRKPTRATLTLLSLAIAFLLFMLLRAVAAAFSGGVELAAVQRVYIDGKYSMTDNLPMAHVRAIGALDEVEHITPMVWFGGYYQNPTQTFAAAPVDPEAFFNVFAELEVADQVLDRFTASKRSVVVAEPLLQQYGWQVGDLIVLRGDIWPRQDGLWDWEFELAGSYAIPSGSRLPPWFLIRLDYYDDLVSDWVKGKAGWAVASLHEGVQPASVVKAVDELFENSSDPTRSLAESDYARQMAKQFGDVGLMTTLILGAVFFTIVLLTANVASMTFRERVPELAVMKTLGFTDRYVAGLMFAESLLLCGFGGLLGIGLAFALQPMLSANLASVLGSFEMTSQQASQAMVVALTIGVGIGIPAALAAQRLPIVDALREAE